LIRCKLEQETLAADVQFEMLGRRCRLEDTGDEKSAGQQACE
jgi:hypothetical protein